MQSPPNPPNPPTIPPPPQPPQPNINGVESGVPRAEKPVSTELALCINITHNLTQLCLGGVIFSALIIANLTELSESLSQHIILCTMGYFILMTQAIISWSPFGWANNLKYQNKKIIHLSMQILESILVITGTFIRLVDVSFSFNSAHGICGFIAMLLAACSLLGGLLSLIFPQTMNNKFMKILHSCVGIITLSFACIALALAFHYYYRNWLGDRNTNISIVLTMFALVGTVLMAMVKNVKRVLE